MYLDLYDNITINKKMLKIVGMPAALYWAELQEILQHVFDKKTFNEKGFFPLDRGYVTKEINLTLKQQYECDAQLKALGILDSDENNPDSIRVSVEKYIAVISAEDPKLLKELVKAAKPTRKGKATATEEEKVAKTNAIRDNLIKGLVETEKILYDAEVNWITTIFELNQYAYKMSKSSVAAFVDTIHKTGYDSTAMKEIIDIAANNGYTDASWAIDRYRRDHKVSATKLNSQQRVATAVGMEF